MELRYGQLLSLRKNIDLDFYCDGILPVGQMGYQETHYKIKFDQASIILPQSLVSELFEEYKAEVATTKAVEQEAIKKDDSGLDLNKLKNALRQAKISFGIDRIDVS